MPLKQKLAKVKLPDSAERERMYIRALIHVFSCKEKKIRTLALTKYRVKFMYSFPGLFSSAPSTGIELTLL